MTLSDRWLNPVNEKVLEPDLSICDAHQHIRNLDSQRYLAADLIKDISRGHNITQTVIIQSGANLEQGPGGGMSPIEETVFVMQQIGSLKSKIDIEAGFVGYADLAAGKAVQSVLEAHLEAGGKRFKGVRYPSRQSVGDDGSNILSDSKFREGFALLKKYKLTYELSLEIPRFPDLVELAKNFQETPIIINHLGWPKFRVEKPDEKAEIIGEWRRGIKMFTPVENIYMKVGGTAKAHRGFGFLSKPNPPSSEDMAKAVDFYYQFVIEQFGPTRCMFESNYSVDKIFPSAYNVIWNAYKIITKSYSKTERAYLFHDTASQVYSL
jgi:L-fuconolactonase